MPSRVHMVGAGAGVDADLLCERAIAALSRAEVVIVDPEISPVLRARVVLAGAEVLERREGLLVDRAADPRAVVSLHRGDGVSEGTALAERAALEAAGIPFEIVPGLSLATLAAHAASGSLAPPRTPRVLVLSSRAPSEPEAPGVTAVAPIAIVPRFANVKQAIAQLDRYRTIVLSSAHAAEVLVGSLASIGRDARALAGIRIAVVGPATARKLEAHGIRPDLVGDAGGEALARELLELGIEGPVLFPRAVGGREELVEILSSAGVGVDVVDAYESVVDSGAIARAIAEHRAAPFDAVAFTSPKASRAFIETIDREGARGLLDRVVLGAIGETTRSALEELGLAVGFVPDHPDAAALVAGLKAMLGDGQKIG